MSKLEKMFAAREALGTEHGKALESVDEKISLLLYAQWDDWKALKDTLIKLDDSTEYGSDEGGIYRWVRFDVSDVAERERPYFDDYMLDRDGCVHADYENGALVTQEGPSIIVNDDGDVLDEDSGKWIIHRRDYKGEEHRAHLIEQWMDKSGYFPGVFEMDRYGNVGTVDTKALAAQYVPEPDDTDDEEA